MSSTSMNLDSHSVMSTSSGGTALSESRVKYRGMEEFISRVPVGPITQAIIHGTRSTWRNFRVQNFVNQVSGTPDNSDRTSSRPSRDSGYLSPPTPDRNTACMSGKRDARTIIHLNELVERKKEQVERLRAEHDVAIAKRDETYGILDGKYQKQLDARKKDYVQLQEATKYMQEVEHKMDEMEEATATLRNQFEDHVVKLQTEAQKREEEHNAMMISVKAGFDSKLEYKTAESDVAQGIAAEKTLEIESLKATVVEKEQELIDANTKAEEKLSKLARTAEANRNVRDKQIERQSSELEQMKADCDDALDNIEDRLLAKSILHEPSEKENHALRHMLREKNPNAEALRDILEQNEARNYSEERIRDEVQQLREHNEELLDQIQKQADTIIATQQQRIDARSDVNHLQSKVYNLEGDNERLQEAIRATAAGSAGGTHLSLLEHYRSENEVLRKTLSQQDLKIDEQHAEIVKLDHNGCKLTMCCEELEEKLRDSVSKYETRCRETSIKLSELALLRNMRNNDDEAAIDEGSKNQLLAHVRNVSDRNSDLESKIAELSKENQEMRLKITTVDEEANVKVWKAQKLIDFYYDCYYNEAVATTEHLHAELHALKAAKGEMHYIQSNQPKNIEVANRKFEYFADDESTSLGPTHEALKALRPHGWRPIYAQGKVWLKKSMKPISQKELEKRISAALADADMLATEVSLAFGPSEEGSSVDHATSIQSGPVDAPSSRHVAPPPGFANVEHDQQVKNQRRLEQALIESSPPRWESRFAGFMCGINDQAAFDELDADNKRMFVQFFEQEGGR